MNKKQYRLSCLKKKLAKRKKDGVKYLIWELKIYEKELIESLGYIVEPFLYCVQTRKFNDIKQIYSSFLQDLHYEKKRGKNYIVKPLSETEKELLDRYRIQYYPLKYKIYLRE